MTDNIPLNADDVLSKSPTISFNVSYSATQVQLRQSKDQKLLEHMMEEYSSRLGRAIGRAKKWENRLSADSKVMTNSLEVYVFTQDELETDRKKYELQATAELREELVDFAEDVLGQFGYDGKSGGLSTLEWAEGIIKQYKQEIEKQ